ncbi:MULTISPECIES: hypothetical protein [Shinella]|uniref:Uncharacterized protein n=1 Tax=Shinella sumterensis TaxID=1967501 RepID=A0AA50CSU2_9HYPH|nr:MULTISPECIES: hypothetical protein [Shinella]MDC7259476.1 hypothetical protein [Shinella sp. YE25]WLS00777.1 hypothetical protein Q9313_24780 [Shinella sumterensis]
MQDTEKAGHHKSHHAGNEKLSNYDCFGIVHGCLHRFMVEQARSRTPPFARLMPWVRIGDFPAFAGAGNNHTSLKLFDGPI